MSPAVVVTTDWSIWEVFVRGNTGGDMIRRALFTVTAAAVAIALPASAGATHSLLDYESAVDALLAVDPAIEPAANDHGKDFAVGGFQHNLRNNNVGFSAHSGPMGGDPWGHLSETIPGGNKARFRVVCLAVMGIDAAIGLRPTHAASNDQTEGFVLAVRDTGMPSGALDEFAFVPDVLPEMCADGLFAAFFTVDSGNILVHDAI
jgi:hypothetical protein